MSPLLCSTDPVTVDVMHMDVHLQGRTEAT